jgi:hypothetical protein
MFKRKQKDNHELTSLRIRVRELERSYYDIGREFNGIMDKWDTITVVKHDMAKMDTTVAMVGELARRLDLAGVADLPSTCICESCGCNK